MKITEALRRNLRLLPVLAVLASFVACGGFTSTYKAYEGEPRQALQISTVAGAQYSRQDWMIRYVDSVRFSHVDGNFIENSDSISDIEIAPGFHDVRVYFFWDLGNQRGLAPALVSYSSTRDTLSRTLRFNARAGERYTVRAQPVFNEVREEITTLQHVDFWVEDGQGNQIVSRAAGRYVPAQ